MTLQKNITNKSWEIDSQIPTEPELMEMYNVGRETVRKAVAMLVQEGILYRNVVSVHLSGAILHLLH